MEYKERSVNGYNIKSIYTLGLKSFLRPVFIRKDSYCNKVVKDYIIKILKALV